MKKKYTTPGIVKVELKPEQAVLGQCSTGVTAASTAANRTCDAGIPCKAYHRSTGDSGILS